MRGGWLGKVGGGRCGVLFLEVGVSFLSLAWVFSFFLIWLIPSAHLCFPLALLTFNFSPRAVGTFARALDCSSSIRQPSLHMSAAAASRDITLVSRSWWVIGQAGLCGDLQSLGTGEEGVSEQVGAFRK